MKRRGVFLGCMVLVGAAGACASQSPNVVKSAPKQATLALPAKPRGFAPVHPGRFVLLDTVGVSYDETGEASPIHTRDSAIVAGKRLVLEGGIIIDSAPIPESLLGFRSLPKRLGGGYVFWSGETTYHASTFLGKLNPFAMISARGGVRPWFDSFVLRTDIGPLEVKPSSFTVRRTELARFSEMISLDGKIGVRTDPIGRMEASVDAGKTFRPVTFDDGKRYTGPLPGPGNTLVFRRDSAGDWSGSKGDRQLPDARVLAPSGALIPFDPKTIEPVVLEPPNWSSPPEEPAYSRRFAPPELGLAVATGAFVPGDQIVFLRETTLRVLSAKTGEFIQDLPLSLGSQEFGHCQPVTIGEDVFLACTHAAGAHLYALRGSPTTVQLEATFPEVGTFVAGLGSRFLFLGRCGSTPPTVRDFAGYGLSEETPDAGEPDPNAPTAQPPEPPAPPEETPEKPANEATVCVRASDGTWAERRIDGLKDRKKALFLPGDNATVTVVVFDKPDADKSDLDKPDLDKSGPDKLGPKFAEGVRFIHVDTKLFKFSAAKFFRANDANEPQLRTVSTNVWLDEKDGSVHGWELEKPKTDEPLEEEEPPEDETTGSSDGETRGRIVGVQIKRDGTIEKYSLPDGVENVVVGGPYALAQAKTDEGPTYYESTNGGRSFTPVPAPVPGDFIEYSGGDVEGCSVAGCSVGGGLVRLGWGNDASTTTPTNGKTDKPEDTDSLTSKVFDPHVLLQSPPSKELHCRLQGKEGVAASDGDKPFAVTLAMNDEVNVGAAVDHKWTALATSPFELKPAYQVLFENVEAESLKGDAVPILRSTSTNPVGLLLRTKEFLFDLSPGPKRKPVGFSPGLRVNFAAEVNRETSVFFDARLGDVVLVRGATARPIMSVHQVPDVNYASLTLARRAGTGDDVFAIALVQTGTGDILLGDLDLGRGRVGPLRVAGNMRNLNTGTACVRSAGDYRMVVNEHISIDFEPAVDGRGGLFGSSFITLGGEKACLEASEMRLVNTATLVVRYTGAGSGGHPAMLHEHGKSLPATCMYE